jgi:hypothetical protein
MDKPTIFMPYQAIPDVEVLPSYFPVPGLGILPMNAFLIKAVEPVLVDTGLALLSDEFMQKLASLIDLGDLMWLWLTHNDQDHIGSLQALLEKAPNCRVITTFLGVGKMSLYKPLPMDRVCLLNPGQKINIGDRTLISIKPPTYDAPETTGLYDIKSGAFFSADCFGALMSEPAVDAAAMGSDRLREGLITWTKVDSPWLHTVDRSLFAQTLGGIRKISPKIILSCHLPPAHHMTEELLGYLAAVPDGEPFIGPDQQGLETFLKSGNGD